MFYLNMCIKSRKISVSVKVSGMRRDWCKIFCTIKVDTQYNHIEISFAPNKVACNLLVNCLLLDWLGSISYGGILVVSIHCLYDTYYMIHFSWTILQTMPFCLNLGYFCQYNSQNHKNLWRYQIFYFKTTQNVPLICIE